MRQIDLRPESATLFSMIALATSPLYGTAISRRSHAEPIARRAATWLRRADAAIRLWQDRSRGRRELLRLDDHVLRDIGITRLQAEAEASKPFWRA
jgi:uncharacterized protein YjiS (DUF1127 family)